MPQSHVPSSSPRPPSGPPPFNPLGRTPPPSPSDPHTYHQHSSSNAHNNNNSVLVLHQSANNNSCPTLIFPSPPTPSPPLTALAPPAASGLAAASGGHVTASQYTAHRAARRQALESAIQSMTAWTASNEQEALHLHDTLQLAKDLLAATVINPALLDGGFTGSSIRSNHGPESYSDPNSAEQIANRAATTRAAIACLLLERICAIFQRYGSLLQPLSEILVRSIFVPDTEEMRSLLGGSVQYELDTQGMSEAHEQLLAPYARKTYATAHQEVSSGVMQLAKLNRSTEIRLSRQGKIFDFTVQHWVSSVVRNFFLSWRHFTRRRVDMRRQFHAKFSRLRVAEAKVRAIRSWRERAASVMRALHKESTGTTEVAQLTESITHLKELINQLTARNDGLGERLLKHESERQQLQSMIATKERLFVELQSRAVEMDRVGSDMLESLLASEPPPPGNNALEVLVAWAHRMIDDAGGSFDDTPLPLSPLLVDEYIVVLPLSAIGLVMTRFNSTNAPSRDSVELMHSSPTTAAATLVEMYEILTEGPCIVNLEQVSSMQRGVLLLFLAGLMRHASNWLACKPMMIPAHRKANLRNGAGGSSTNVVAALNANSGPMSGSFLAPPSPPKRAKSPATPTRVGAGPSASSSSHHYASPNDVVGNYHHWMERVQFQQQWIATSMAALHLALEASTQRPVMLTSEEQEDLVTFLDVSLLSIVDIMPQKGPDLLFMQLLKALQQVFPELRKVYYAYAVPSMLYLDFFRLAKDCRLFGSSKLSKRDVEQLCKEVFVRHAARAATKTNNNNAGATGSKRNSFDEEDDDDAGGMDALLDHNPSTNTAAMMQVSFRHRQAGIDAADGSDANERSLKDGNSSTTGGGASGNVDISIKLMEPRVFTECIIRLALLYQRRLARDPHLELTVTMVGVFVLETLVPHALRLDVDRFRQTARHSLVRQVLAKHKVALRKAFRRYATINEGEAISKIQFHTMAKDCRWINRTINADVITEVFRRCVGSVDEASAANGAPTSSVQMMSSPLSSNAAAAAALSANVGLDLNEWHEALCALAVYHDPNPLLPLHQKLNPFIEEKVLSALQL